MGDAGNRSRIDTNSIIGLNWDNELENADAASLAEQLSAMIAENSRLSQQLDAQKRILAELNPVDSVLGLGNRHAYQQRVSLEVAMAARGRRFGLIVLNVINFTRILVLNGFPFGRQILKVVAVKVKPFLSSVDLFSHLGGGEFAVLLPDRRLSEIEGIYQALRCELQEVRMSNSGIGRAEHFRGSLGYATLSGPFTGSYDARDVAVRLYRLADRVRYRGYEPNSAHSRRPIPSELHWQEDSFLAILERAIGHRGDSGFCTDDSKNNDEKLIKAA